MANKVLCAYVTFASPGPAEDRMQNEIQSIFRLLASNYHHDFSSCHVQVEIGDIADMGELDTVTIGVMQLLKIELKCEEDYPIMRVPLETNNPQFPVVQIAWAYKE